MDEAKIQSSLLGWIIALAITISVMLRREKDLRQILFVVLSGNITLYYFTQFFYHFLSWPWIERLSLVTAILIPFCAIYFFRTFGETKKHRIKIEKLASIVGVILIFFVLYPTTLKPALGMAIFAYILGFTLVAIFDLNVQASSVSTRVDSARIRYLAAGGFVAIILLASDHLGHIVNFYIPPLGLVFTLLYLYMISQSIVRYRILDLYEMLGRLAVLTLMGGFLALIYYFLVLQVGMGKGFLLNAFLASLVILLLFDPLRDFVEQKISDFFFGERVFLEQKIAELRLDLAHVFTIETMVEMLISGLENSRRFTHASIFLIDAHGAGYNILGYAGPKPEVDRIDVSSTRRYLRSLATGGALVGTNLESRRAKSLQAGKGDTTEDLNESLTMLHQLRADIILFMDGEQDLMGFLCVKDERIRDGFTPEEIQALVGLAAQATITVENSQLYQQMKERDRLAALGEMSAGLAHEIRNPLGAIKAAAQFIEEVAQEKEDDAEYLGIIVEEVNRLNGVVNDFLSYARPSSGAPARVNINEILQRTIQVYETGRKNPIKIKLELEQQLPGVFIDSGRLHQVFLNLIINAEQALKNTEKARLVISEKLRKMRRINRENIKQKNASHVEIRFADNGPGIDPSVLQKVFIPFFTTKSKGSGLGLSICHRLVKEAGGEMEVRSQLGHGSIFSVVLPVVSDDEE